jgi:hypothetical protein
LRFELLAGQPGTEVKLYQLLESKEVGVYTFTVPLGVRIPYDFEAFGGKLVEVLSLAEFEDRYVGENNSRGSGWRA